MLPATQHTALNGVFPVVQALTNLLSNMLLPLPNQLLLHALDCCAAFLMYTRLGLTPGQAVWQCCVLLAALVTSSGLVEAVLSMGYEPACARGAEQGKHSEQAATTNWEAAEQAGCSLQGAAAAGAAASTAPQPGESAAEQVMPATSGRAVSQLQQAGAAEESTDDGTMWSQAMAAQLAAALPDLDYKSPLQYTNVGSWLSYASFAALACGGQQPAHTAAAYPIPLLQIQAAVCSHRWR
jgi:hypothetical protein